MIVNHQGAIAKTERIDSASESGNAADYIETLKFIPEYNQDGKKLTCVVTHSGYTESQIKEKQNMAEILLNVYCKQYQMALLRINSLAVKGMELVD